ncbi:hypothetical protein MAE02_48340 [Microvirga aerophila]|uniref:Uncharacterized protein n=1 Tax=Microvirga aerophila TaxID=670291 RepID=A0A512BYX4_9HYPH|nr:hypothetical protein MAE02_48340 [Microvirga aerophila]
MPLWERAESPEQASWAGVAAEQPGSEQAELPEEPRSALEAARSSREERRREPGAGRSWPEELWLARVAARSRDEAEPHPDAEPG